MRSTGASPFSRERRRVRVDAKRVAPSLRFEPLTSILPIAKG
jgi:hypothetical protein